MVRLNLQKNEFQTRPSTALLRERCPSTNGKSISKTLKMKPMTLIALIFALYACDSDTWSCRVEGDAMFSVSDSGALGGAGRGCSCDEMRDFEYRTFGSVDEEALRADFGCRF